MLRTIGGRTVRSEAAHPTDYRLASAVSVASVPLHRQVIPWAMRKNVEVVHRPDNWLEWAWVTVR